jgi:hypothetical protein
MDAGVFRPERWEADMPLLSKPTNVRWGYIPFGAGPRSCLGSESIEHMSRARPEMMLTDCPLVEFALTEAAYTIVRLVQEFPVLKLPRGEPIQLVGVEEQRTALVLWSGIGCRVATA